MKSHWMIFLISTMLALVLSAGCDKNPTDPDPGVPPELPPMSTFLMDFSAFQQNSANGASVAGMMPDQTLSKLNWGFSALQVGVWNSLITLGMAIPVATFGQALQQTPTYAGNNTWVWEYSVPAGVQAVTCTMTGKRVEEGVEWSMAITQHGVFEDFVWYTGFCNYQISEGYWILFKSPDDRRAMLRTDWHRDPATESGDIRYTNILEGDAENGGYIAYEKTLDTLYDRHYDIYNKGKDNLTEIEWNATTKAGRVKDPNHFGNSDWQCWDENFNDVDCS